MWIAKLAAVEFKSLFADVEARQVDVYRLSWVGDYNDPYNFLQYLKSDFGINLPHYNSAGLRRACWPKPGARRMPGKRREILEQAERLMLADHPVIPLYFYVNKHLVKPEVQGWYDNVMNVVYSQDLALLRLRADKSTQPRFRHGIDVTLPTSSPTRCCG